MVDYYKIVQRFVAALNPDTEATRQALYERARAALAKQLLLQNPPVPNESVRAEFAALEDAIKKTESEAWSRQYEIKDKKEAAGAKEGSGSSRSATVRFIWPAFLLVAGADYFVYWMRVSVSASTTTALVLLLLFALPAVFIFIFAIYPILLPLLRLLRWINKKSLRRLGGGEITANAAGATVLTAILCAICAFAVPHLFSWWAAGWCWFSCVVLLTLDPGVVAGLRTWLRGWQRSKAATATGPKRLSLKGFFRWRSAHRPGAPGPEKGLSKAA
jgi:hypothetical protein